MVILNTEVEKQLLSSIFLVLTYLSSKIIEDEGIWRCIYNNEKQKYIKRVFF